MEIFLEQLKDGEVNKNSTRLKYKVEEWPNFQIKKKQGEIFKRWNGLKNSKNRNVIDLYGRMNEFKTGCQPISAFGKARKVICL